jgi:chromosomal replication initiation ATPase DnaA
MEAKFMDELLDQRKSVSFYVYPGLKMIPNGTISEKLIAICKANDVTIEEIKSSSRKYRLVAVRQSFCFLSKKKTTLSLNQIGSLIDRNHATVIHSIKMTKNRKEMGEKDFIKIYRLCRSFI